MAVVTTYPGVYIQEIPSGVQTITGVATSIAAFIGYTDQGPVDQAIHIFSFADFQRSFGGITVDSTLSYAVNQFFQNGGTEAYVVRVAHAALSASVTLATSAAAGDQPVIKVTAASDGTWGNLVQLDLDYNTVNPDSLFNLTVTQFVNQNGQLVPSLVETYRNLSMSNMNPNYFLSAITAASQLIQVSLLLPSSSFTDAGTSQSGVFAAPTGGLTTSNNRVAVSVDGGTPQEFALFPTPVPTPTVDDLVNFLNTTLPQQFNPAPSVAKNSAGNAVIVQSPTTGQSSSVRFLNASYNDACGVLKLGVGNGGIEVEGAAPYRPVLNGTLGAVLPATLPALKPNATININVYQAGSTSPMNGTNPIPLQVWGPTIPTTISGVVTAIVQALAALPSPASQFLAGTQVEVDTLLGAAQFRVVLNLPGNVYCEIVDSGDGTANALGLSTPQSINFAHYMLGSGSGDTTVKTVSASISGANGSAPTLTTDFGDPTLKTGMYSLDAVDLFNILCLPDLVDNPTLTSDYATVYQQALLYCQQRRAVLIVDLPVGTTTITGAQNWLNTTGSSLLAGGAYAAAYFPRIVVADPLQNGNLRAFPNCGAVAGIWARTDAQRGVWKAPAGTETQIAGVSQLAYRMNDQENGILNPLGLNCLRTFPVIGTVVWGARTLRGADALDDDYKYLPIRRLTNFLEESLFRGTQWVVFEPNDEPLWARVRLTVGSFMQAQYAQGAFAGQTPSAAYFVKCDSESTTAYDQDQGRVNIIVGFAPLRPAEFVIIQIQQISSVGPS
jgi:phage tail sheath protein FI